MRYWDNFPFFALNSRCVSYWPGVARRPVTFLEPSRKVTKRSRPLVRRSCGLPCAARRAGRLRNSPSQHARGLRQCSPTSPGAAVLLGGSQGETRIAGAHEIEIICQHRYAHSIRPDPCVLHDLRPLRNITAYHRRKLHLTATAWLQSLRQQFFAQISAGKCAVDFSGELIDAHTRRCSGQ